MNSNLVKFQKWTNFQNKAGKQIKLLKTLKMYNIVQTMNKNKLKM